MVRRLWIIGVLVGLSACSPPPPPAQPVVEVIVTELSQQSVPIYGNYIGITRASLDVEVRARVSGYLEEKHFIEGSYVQKDQLLYSLDPGPYDAAMDSAEAEKTRAVNDLDKAKRDIARLTPLYEQDAASQLDLDNAYSARDAAMANLKAAEASLKQAKLNLDYTQVKAPVAGVTGDSKVDIGALVGESGESLLNTVQRVNPIYVEFQMSTLDYLQARRRLRGYFQKLKADAEGTSVEGLVTITLPDGEPYPLPGEVKFTEPRINSDTGTFTVRAELANPERELLAGQYTKVRIQLDELQDTLTVPEKAVRFEQSGTFVFVVMADNIVEQRFVILGRNIGGAFLVESGLSQGETVVIEGTHKIQHRRQVKPFTEEQQAQRLAESEAS